MESNYKNSWARHQLKTGRHIERTFGACFLQLRSDGLFHVPLDLAYGLRQIHGSGTGIQRTEQSFAQSANDLWLQP